MEFVLRPSAGKSVALPVFLCFALLLTVAFVRPLYDLVAHVAGSGLHSYILLVPVITGYLIYLKRARLPSRGAGSPILAAIPAALGLVALGTAWSLRADEWSVSQSDLLTLYVLAYVACLISGALALLGWNWLKVIAFPSLFLILLVPLPDRFVALIESGLKFASADAASMFFSLTSLPVFRDGLVFHLPGVTMEVAQECSGIRSTLVLLVTSLVASYLLLNTAWRRTLFFALVIPLGVLRNGLRIWLLGMLAVRVDPEILNSALHRRGGPIFFILSLVPLLVLLLWLKRNELRSVRRRNQQTVLS